MPVLIVSRDSAHYISLIFKGKGAADDSSLYQAVLGMAYYHTHIALQYAAVHSMEDLGELQHLHAAVSLKRLILAIFRILQ